MLVFSENNKGLIDSRTLLFNGINYNLNAQTWTDNISVITNPLCGLVLMMMYM